VNFYDLDPKRQQAESFGRLSRYLTDVVGRYHPYLRRAYRDRGISIGRLKTPNDLLTLPLIHKDQLRANPALFVVQPRVDGRTSLPDGYDTEPLTRWALAKLAARAVLNRDPSADVRPATFRERVERRGQLEWFPIHYHVTTGSTGDPTPITFTHYDLHGLVRELAALVIAHKRPRPDYQRFDWTERWMSLMPAAPHVAFYSTVLTKILVGTSGFETFGGAVIPTDRQLEIFARGGFATVTAIPSYMTYWLRRAVALQQNQRIGPLSTLRRLLLGAEPISESLREALRALALEAGAHSGVKVLQSYAMTEFKWVFLECDEGTGIHLNPKYYYWELLDPETHRPVRPGEPGALVFSHIGWRGTVLIRYWTGDLVKGGMRWDRCERCGYTFPRIFPPICRLDKDFTKIKGARVDLSLLVETVRDTPGVRQFQIHLEPENEEDELSRDVVSVYVLPEPKVIRGGIEQAVRERLKARTEVTPDRVLFEDDEVAFEKRLFARTGIKADYVVERRRNAL
jgi:phenylacetate-coenzyme A ligase PaaK-like adenylate-forming protein